MLMKKNILVSLLILFSVIPACAQVKASIERDQSELVGSGEREKLRPQVKFGFLSYEQALQAMPGWEDAQSKVEQISAQYEAEMKRAADEFSVKYEAFLEEQQTLAPAIRDKRQAELQELMEHNLSFKQKARQLIDEAKINARQPFQQQLADILQQVGRQRGYLFIANTDSNAFPWIDDMQGEDIQDFVRQIALDRKSK